MAGDAFIKNPPKIYGTYTGGFIGFVIFLAIAERMGIPNHWIGWIFMAPWFGIKDISAGLFGIPAGMLTLIVVSLLTKAPDAKMQAFVESVRYPCVKTA